MDKNIYETYEFLPTSSTEAEADQFFVVQNDGTLLINRPVQYVTQVQNVKGMVENGQPCSAVYDVSSQEYYVDVDNSTELISVSDQFALSQDGTSTDFGNNYLLQSIPSIPASSVQMAEAVTIGDLKELSVKTNEEETNQSTFQGSDTTNFTEVTLNDEQYQTLEVKGWVLLEYAGKIYLLNTLGLHDITDNAELVENLRNDVEVIEPSVLNNTKNETTFYGFEEIVTASIETKQELIFPDAAADTRNSYVETQSTGVIQVPLETSEPANVTPATSNLCSSESQELLETPPVPPVTTNSNQVGNPPSVENTDALEITQAIQDARLRPEISKPSMIVRLKTNVAVEDIPNKIVLGKTVNGKRLVAKVMSIKRPTTTMDSCSKNNPKEPDNSSSKDSTVVTKTVNKKSSKESYYRAEEVESLIQEHIASPKELASSVEDVKSAELLIKQLLNVPATRTPMVERNLIITRIVKTMSDDNHMHSESEPTLVTGRVAQFDDKGEWHFIYIPHLLQKLNKDVTHGDESDIATPTGAPIRHAVSLEDYLLHVHVVETKSPNVPTKTSVTFSKKRIPTRLQVLTNKSIYACSACAKIFTNEKDLSVHQTVDCMEVEEEKPPLVIDTDSTPKQISILKNNRSPAYKTKHYSPCIYCNAKVKLSSYKRHLQSHIGPVAGGGFLSKESEVGTNNAKPTMYKCKMCCTYYYHASTLSKHILSHHIQSNIKICMV